MAVLDDANRLVAAGRRDEAVALVHRAASEDDPEALFAVANWKIYGLFGSRDLGAAHGLLDRAVALGHLEATRVKAALLANGTGAEPQEGHAIALLESIRDRDALADRQLELLQSMAAADEIGRLRVDVLSEDPEIRMVEGLLSQAECAYLIELATPELRPSFVIDPATGRQVPHPTRKSSGMNFGPTLEDPVVRRINERLAIASGTDVTSGEPLQVLRYVPGEEYRPHMDALPGVTNQRIWTVLAYLNEGYGGGETRFDRLNIDARGKTGDGLVFVNATPSGEGDPRTRHAGLPVTSGVKWLATRWIRMSPLDPFDRG